MGEDPTVGAGGINSIAKEVIQGGRWRTIVDGLNDPHADFLRVELRIIGRLGAAKKAGLTENIRDGGEPKLVPGTGQSRQVCRIGGDIKTRIEEADLHLIT